MQGPYGFQACCWMGCPGEMKLFTYATSTWCKWALIHCMTSGASGFLLFGKGRANWSTKRGSKHLGWVWNNGKGEKNNVWGADLIWVNTKHDRKYFYSHLNRVLVHTPTLNSPIYTPGWIWHYESNVPCPMTPLHSDSRQNSNPDDSTQGAVSKTWGHSLPFRLQATDRSGVLINLQESHGHEQYRLRLILTSFFECYINRVLYIMLLVSH